jgi:epoxyqueuosine reductase
MQYAESIAWLQARASVCGFPLLGVTAVRTMDPLPLRSWLDAGFGAGMDYLERHLALRANLTLVLPQARSVISVGLPYAGPRAGESPVGSIAHYARCADYHTVVAERLQMLWEEIRQRHPEAEGRIFVDSGPLPERELARRAGLGWVGRHSCLISPHWGSRFVLGEVLTTLALEPTETCQGTCGDCHACIAACPTGALTPAGMVDARRCLSYLTIEHKGPIPRELRPCLGIRLFGCDCCQDVCPHNRGVGEESLLLTHDPQRSALDLNEILLLTPDAFRARFRATALWRAKRRGVLRNACVALGNLGAAANIPVLTQALHDVEPLVRGHAAWALGRLQATDALGIALLAEADVWVREEIAYAMDAGAAAVDHPGVTA